MCEWPQAHGRAAGGGLSACWRLRAHTPEAAKLGGRDVPQGIPRTSRNSTPRLEATCGAEARTHTGGHASGKTQAASGMEAPKPPPGLWNWRGKVGVRKRWALLKFWNSHTPHAHASVQIRIRRAHAARSSLQCTTKWSGKEQVIGRGKVAFLKSQLFLSSLCSPPPPPPPPLPCKQHQQ